MRLWSAKAPNDFKLQNCTSDVKVVYFLAAVSLGVLLGWIPAAGR